MKDLLKTVLVAGTSFAAGYILCRYTQESYYFGIAEQRVNEAEEEHDRYAKHQEEFIEKLQHQLEEMQLAKLTEYAAADVIATEKQFSVDDAIQEQFPPKHAAVEEVAETALTSYQGGPVPGQKTDYTKFAGKTESREVIVPQLPKYNDSVMYAAQPQLISEDEYINTERTRVVTLYTIDDVLVDEMDTPILGGIREQMLGNLDGAIAPHVNHEGNVFIYNPHGDYAVQVIINMGAYSAEV